MNFARTAELHQWRSIHSPWVSLIARVICVHCLITFCLIQSVEMGSGLLPTSVPRSTSSSIMGTRVAWRPVEAKASTAAGIRLLLTTTLPTIVDTFRIPGGLRGTESSPTTATASLWSSLDPGDQHLPTFHHRQVIQANTPTLFKTMVNKKKIGVPK